MENNKNDLPTITGILIQDPDDHEYTAYFAEFPEVIAEGKTVDEVKKNLFEALKTMLEIRRSEISADIHTHGRISSFDYPLQLA